MIPVGAFFSKTRAISQCPDRHLPTINMQPAFWCSLLYEDPLGRRAADFPQRFFDMLDGAVARSSGRVTRFGAVLEPMFWDRYAETSSLIGIALASYLGLVLGCFRLFGWSLASFTRAKAESVGGFEELIRLGSPSDRRNWP